MFLIGNSNGMEIADIVVKLSKRGEGILETNESELGETKFYDLVTGKLYTKSNLTVKDYEVDTSQSRPIDNEYSRSRMRRAEVLVKGESGKEMVFRATFYEATRSRVALPLISQKPNWIIEVYKPGEWVDQLKQLSK